MTPADLPSWKYRRRATFLVLYFGAAVLLYVLLSDDARASAYQDVRLSRYQRDPYAHGPSTEDFPHV
jgi:hypothetical protein